MMLLLARVSSCRVVAVVVRGRKLLIGEQDEPKTTLVVKRKKGSWVDWVKDVKKYKPRLGLYPAVAVESLKSLRLRC
jgi:hypothetical protein